ncbi:MAG: helix-turn-helix domain-containing protein [Neptuniibacter sp.]
MQSIVNNNVNDSFGTRLRNERTRLKLNQTQLGNIGEVSRVTQALYEADERSPNAEYLMKIGSVGVRLDYLLNEQYLNNISEGEILESSTLGQVYSIVDHHCRDNQGVLLDVGFRRRVFEEICDLIQSEGKLPDDLRIQDILRKSA